MATEAKQFRKVKSIMGNYSIYQPVIPLSSFYGKRLKPGKAKKLKQCGCRIMIPIDQDSCIRCWQRMQGQEV